MRWYPVNKNAHGQKFSFTSPSKHYLNAFFNHPDYMQSSQDKRDKPLKLHAFTPAIRRNTGSYTTVSKRQIRKFRI